MCQEEGKGYLGKEKQNASANSIASTLLFFPAALGYGEVKGRGVTSLALESDACLCPRPPVMSWRLKEDHCCLVTQSCPTLATPWTVVSQAPLSMGLPRQEYWSGLPFPSPGNLPNPGIKPASPALASGFFSTEPPGKPSRQIISPLNFSPLMWKVEKTAPHSWSCYKD